MQDLLAQIFQEIKFNPDAIDHITCGAEYTAVILKNGHMGICANLNYQPCCDLSKLSVVDLNNIAHRITIIAYINAINNPHQTTQKGDIFEVLKFKSEENNIMIGYFIPLVEKFDKTGVELTVFDIALDHPRVTDYKLLEEKLSTADSVVITSTTLMNNSLTGLLQKIKPGAKKYLLGPSSIMHSVYKQYDIEAVFGTKFGQHNLKVEELIKEGFGSMEFLKFSQKVAYFV
jgi:uncharacterized protein (DUF4213/DUF364 family)